MKTTIKGLQLTISLGASFKGSLDEIPAQGQELSETHLKDADVSASVEVKAGLEEATADITPEESLELFKGLVDVASKELEARLHRESMRLERDRINLERDKARNNKE